MTDGPPRLTPLAPPHPPEIAAGLARWMPPGAGVEPLALFRTLLRHPPLADAMHALGSYFLGRRSRLPLRTREIVIDRVCARCGCTYEWGVHVAAFAVPAGLSDDQVRATACGPGDDPAWEARDARVVQLVDALHDGGEVPDVLWRALAADHDDAQLLELLVLAGWYHAIAYVANGVRVPAEAWAAPLPDASGPAA